MAKKPNELQLQTEDDRARMAAAGLGWLFELELINSDKSPLLNILYGNLYSYPRVSDVEILIDRYQRKMLIWVRFTWIARKFLRKSRNQIKMDMLDQLQELLPSFEFRIIEDRPLFDKALKKMEEILFGGTGAQKPSETPSSAPPLVGDAVPSGGTDAAQKPESGVVAEGIPTDPKKPSQT